MNGLSLSLSLCCYFSLAWPSGLQQQIWFTPSPTWQKREEEECSLHTVQQAVSVWEVLGSNWRGFFFCSNAALASDGGLSVREHAAAILVMRGHAASSNGVVLRERAISEKSSPSILSTQPWKTQLLGNSALSDWWIFPFFSVLSPLSSPTGWYSLLLPLGKLCLHNSVSVLHIVKRKGAALGLAWGPLLADRRMTDDKDLRSKENRRPVPSRVSAGRTINNKSIWEFQHFSIVLHNNCSFPSSRQDNDRLHTKRLKIAKWLRAGSFFYILSAFIDRVLQRNSRGHSVRRKIQTRTRKSGGISGDAGKHSAKAAI